MFLMARYFRNQWLQLNASKHLQNIDNFLCVTQFFGKITPLNYFFILQN